MAFTPRGLTPDPSGNLLGVAESGGTANSTCEAGCGTVFKLTPGAGAWSLSVIYSFSGGSDGGYPISPLVFDRQGNLFGTTLLGGSGQCPNEVRHGFRTQPEWKWVELQRCVQLFRA